MEVDINNINKLKSSKIEGRRINLRLVKETDAEFILSLRLNPDLNRFIGKTESSIDTQRKWIRSSIKDLNDFTFIIEDKDGEANGTISIYNIDYEKNIAEWGRWILKPKSSMYFSIESTLLAFFFAFEILKLSKLIGGNNNENINSIKFHTIYATVTSIDENYTWYKVEKKKLSSSFGEI